ncbi:MULTISPECIES: DUF5105 domain-containing protein [Clostridium]|uniref:Lipoprotein n=1 Tax=Clostridium botulinum B str. Osaka05 TaxID=1407017 RepID=A0A0S6U115_CLOBO|nr:MULTISPECIES: DUF5105 domain-containing protein [Clostridium]EJE7234828.1 DUF5105 domain-containing protein [Clostridium botulinum]KYN76741.1 hypothetical protein A0J52_13815 [Clostridium sporogenes]NFD94300.1 DUF5105 domain-containing protein [Clostridium sporogenes]NFE47403.1 DUF5105 domain-containing protein [Clostridium sporogenes]NFE79486.1 DUF5105 domain-containing protein [Clostridium sporogenes]
MKKAKKSLILSLILLFIPVMVIGCSSKPKVGADETTKILFDFYIKGDKESLSKIKISKEQTEEISKMQKDKTISTIKTNFTAEGLKISDEQVNQIYAARVSALKKLSSKTEVVSQDDKSAQVKLKSTYIDEVALDKKAGMDAVEEVKKMNLTDRQEAINKAKDIYIKNLIKSYENVKPSSDMKEKTFKLTIKEKTWMPEDMKNFGESIVKLTSGIK